MVSNPLTQLPGSSSIFAGMYTPLVGPPATGKGRVIKAVGSILKSGEMKIPFTAGGETKLVPVIHCSPDKITCEQLIAAVGKIHQGAQFHIEVGGKKEVRTISHCSYALIIEELEVLFSSMSHDTVNILGHLWDSGDIDYETKRNGEFHAKNVCLNMLAGTTPEAVKDLINEGIIKKGFTSRLVMVYAEAPRFYRSFRDITVEQQTAYNELLRHCKLLATKVIGEVRFSKEAEEYFNGIYETGKMLRVNADPKLDHYYGRKKMHWLKLSIALFFSELENIHMVSQPYIIPQSVVEQAYKWLNKVEINMHHAFKSTGRNELYEISQSVVRYVVEQKEVRYKKLFLEFYKETTKDEFNSCLEYLLATEQLHNINKRTSMIEEGIFAKNGKMPSTAMEEIITGK